MSNLPSSQIIAAELWRTLCFCCRVPPLIGKSAFAAAVQAQPNQPSPRFDGTSEIQEIKVLGDWAFMWTKLSVVVTPPGGVPPFTRAGHTLSILKKQDGKWLLARDGNMVAPGGEIVD